MEAHRDRQDVPISMCYSATQVLADRTMYGSSPPFAHFWIDEDFPNTEVVIENASGMGLLESDTEIVTSLDDEWKLKFSRNRRVEFLAEAGKHTLHDRVGGVHSLPTKFRAETGDLIGWRSLFCCYSRHRTPL